MKVRSSKVPQIPPEHAHHGRKMADMVWAAAFARHFSRAVNISNEEKANNAYSFACYCAHEFKKEHARRLAGKKEKT